MHLLGQRRRRGEKPDTFQSLTSFSYRIPRSPRPTSTKNQNSLSTYYVRGAVQNDWLVLFHFNPDYQQPLEMFP